MTGTDFLEFPIGKITRQHIEIQSVIADRLVYWNQIAARFNIRIDLIAPQAKSIVWTNSLDLIHIMDGFVLTAVEASVSGERIEIELRPSDDEGEWITIAVRDWAGGKPDAWPVSASIQQLAKQLEGYIDVANYPGRSTVCSLHIPTGKLQGWLRRQSPSALMYHVSWSPERNSELPFERNSILDASIQRCLIKQCSYVFLNNFAFLSASSFSIDEALFKSLNNKSLRCEHLGTIQAFVSRIEGFVSSSADRSKTSDENQTNSLRSNLRIDPPELLPSSSRDPRQRALTTPSRNRVRPRQLERISWD